MAFEKIEEAWQEIQEEIGASFSGGFIEVLGDDDAERVMTEFDKSDAEGRACLIRKMRELLKRRTMRAETQALDATRHTNERKTKAAQENANAVRRFCNLTVDDFSDAVGVSSSFLYSTQVGRKPVLDLSINLGLHPTLMCADGRTLRSLADISGANLNNSTSQKMKTLLSHNDGEKQTQYAPDVWAAKIIDTGYSICDGMPPLLAVPSIIIGRHRAGREGAKLMFSLRDQMSKDISGECRIPNVIKRRFHRRFREPIN